MKTIKVEANGVMVKIYLHGRILRSRSGHPKNIKVMEVAGLEMLMHLGKCTDIVQRRLKELARDLR